MHHKSFTYHKSSQIFYYVLFVISLIETPAVHFLLTIWLDSTIAWVITILTILSIIYLIVDFFALKNKPIIIDDEMIYFRLGNRVKLDISLSNIEHVSSLSSLDYAQKVKEQITQLTPAIEITTLLEFKEPIMVKGRETKKIAIYLDEPNEFTSVISPLSKSH